MHILDQIIAQKRVEVAARKKSIDQSLLCARLAYLQKTHSLVQSLAAPQSTGIIAEFKRSSPSKGIINSTANPALITEGYQSAGAAAVSILTDEYFFSGSDNDILASRPALHIPILRKEFIIDPYQIHEAKSLGADVILLIAACLTPAEVRALAGLAKELKLEVLLELHDEEEFEHICADIDLVGINNRSLKTFTVDVERSLKMATQIPSSFLKVAESGIDDPLQIKMFRESGYHGFLIGENFMRHANPAQALTQFINQISAV